METQIIFILFGSFLLLLLIGAPITVALGVSTLISFIVLEDNPIKFVQIAFTSVGSFPLMALPAFILAGALMESAGLSRRLINVAESFAGPFTGG
ncbi:MAG: TRAP transporter large permease subunit, partial [Roseobacter sp.]